MDVNRRDEEERVVQVVATCRFIASRFDNRFVSLSQLQGAGSTILSLRLHNMRIVSRHEAVAFAWFVDVPLTVAFPARAYVAPPQLAFVRQTFVQASGCESCG